MILVILGAGASYDSVPSKPPSITTYDRTRLPNRPPLANELFADTPIVNDTLALFPECHPIVPYLQNLPQGSTIESVLEGLQAESEADLFRKRQLVAVRCLKGLLPQTRTILSIGWRGMETHFLKMLAESLAGKPAIGTCAVAGNSTAAKDVLAQFRNAGISITGSRYDKGFTEFVKSRRAEIFCGKEVRLRGPEESATIDDTHEAVVNDSNFDPRIGSGDFDPRVDRDKDE